jgi:translation initiation factor 5
MINVNRNMEDTFYRYKMPPIKTKIEGRGNGIKTAIPNIIAVAKAIDRPPNWLLKYLAIELGAGCKIQLAQTLTNEEDGRYIINGKFTAKELQDLLDEFIKKFVLCTKCENPETKLRITSKKQIESKCIACGHIYLLPMVHKLTKYIVNNPPNTLQSTSSSKRENKLTKVERRALKLAQSQSTNNYCKEQPEISSNIDQRAVGGMIVAPNIVEDRTNEEEEWSVDVSEEAIKLRTLQLGSGVAHLTMTNDLDKSMGERLEIFNSFVIEKKKEKRFPSKQIISEASRLECSDKAVMVLVQQLWSNAHDVVSAMAKYQGLFQRFTMDKPKAQMYTLQAVEKLIELDPTQLNKMPRYLKQIYDLDLVDDDIFIEWGEKPGKGVSKELAVSIRQASKDFLDWLKNAEVESSEDENVEFESVASLFSIDQSPPLAKEETEKKEKEKHDSDDFDIDDL